MAQMELFSFYNAVAWGGYEVCLEFNKSDALLAYYFCSNI